MMLYCYADSTPSRPDTALHIIYMAAFGLSLYYIQRYWPSTLPYRDRACGINALASQGNLQHGNLRLTRIL